MKRHLILLLVIALTALMLFIGISCKEEISSVETGKPHEEAPTTAVRLINNTSDERNPSWSPDGKMIAFITARDGNGEIYIMNADGSGQTNLTNSPANDYAPSWSPDGKKIAFWSANEGNSEIYFMNIDGSGQTNMTNHPANDCALSWSPDGKKIAFTSNRDGNWENYVMNAEG